MRVTIDRNRVSHIDGEPFFLLGARHMPLGATAGLLADAGFNAYRTLAFGHDVAEPEPPPADDEPLYHWSYLYDRTLLGRHPDYRRQLTAYDAILCGSTGLTFALYKTPVESDMWHDTCRVVAELRDLAPALTAPPWPAPVTVTYEDLGYTIWDGVLTLARRRGDDLYLFAANTAFDPARVTMTLEGLSGSAVARVHGEEREVPVVRGALRDDFGPYDVHVYQLRAVP